MQDKKIVLETRELTKYFGRLKALDRVSMKLYDKEIIAVVGDNGAGKSTFIKTITGVHRRDHGQIFIYGRKADIKEPADALAYGIETVYQSGGVLPNLDAPSNIFLGREKIKENFLGKLFKLLDYRYMREETIKMLASLSIEIPDIRVSLENLSGGQMQAVAVGRAIYWGGRILIFDEPTRNMGVKQQKKIIDIIKKTREQFGVSIMVIFHDIDHIFELADRILVLKDGKKVGEKNKQETNENEIISMMLGH